MGGQIVNNYSCGGRLVSEKLNQLVSCPRLAHELRAMTLKL